DTVVVVASVDGVEIGIVACTVGVSEVAEILISGEVIGGIGDVSCWIVTDTIDSA
nr:hypothetical protein [Tanacetum cinerariifolium]